MFAGVERLATWRGSPAFGAAPARERLRPSGLRVAGWLALAGAQAALSAPCVVLPRAGEQAEARPAWRGSPGTPGRVLPGPDAHSSLSPWQTAQRC